MSKTAMKIQQIDYSAIVYTAMHIIWIHIWLYANILNSFYINKHFFLTDSLPGFVFKSSGLI